MNSLLAELRDLNPDAVTLDNMDDAIVGLGRRSLSDPIAVYSQALIFEKLARDGFSAEEAAAYFQEKLADTSDTQHAPVILLDVAEE